MWSCTTCPTTKRFQTLKGLHVHRGKAHPWHKRTRVKLERHQRTISRAHDIGSKNEATIGLMTMEESENGESFDDDDRGSLRDSELQDCAGPPGTSTSSVGLDQGDSKTEEIKKKSNSDNERISREDLLYCRITKWRYQFGISSAAMDNLFSIMKDFQDVQLPKSFKTVIGRVRKYTPSIKTRKGCLEVMCRSTAVKRNAPAEKLSFFVETRSIVNLITHALSDPEINQKGNIILSPNDDESLQDQDVKYTEICTGKWWEDEHKRIHEEYPEEMSLHVLPLIFYADGTNVDNFGKRSMKPLMVSLGIFKSSFRRTLKSKMCIGYFPTPEKAMSASEKLELYHGFWSFVLQELEDLRMSSKPYIEVNVDGFGVVRLVPSICFIASDHPEAQLLCCHKNSNATNTPCRICLCPKQELNQLSARYPLRLKSEMERARSSDANRCFEFSLQEDVIPAFTNMKLLQTNQGIFGSSPPCIMHTFFSKGLVMRLFAAVVQILGSDSPPSVLLRSKKSRIREFSRRWEAMPSFANDGNYLRKFRSNIIELKLLTATDYLHMMMQLRAVLGTVSNLFMTSEQFSGILQCLDALHDLIRIVKYTSKWTLRHVQELKSDIERFGNIWRKHISQFQTSEFNILKFHMLSHIPGLIEMFGDPMSFDTATFESAHKFNVKLMFKLTNKSRDAASQMIKHLAAVETCNVICEKFLRQSQDSDHDDEDQKQYYALEEKEVDDEDDEKKDMEHQDGSFIDYNRPFVVGCTKTDQKQILNDIKYVTGVVRSEEIRNLLKGFIMEEMNVSLDVADQFFMSNNLELSTQAKFPFGTLRAVKNYTFSDRNQQWSSRYDDIEIVVEGNDAIEERWFARCAGFVTIGKLQGVFVQSYKFHSLKRYYDEETNDFAVLKWWPEMNARHRNDRLEGDIIHLRVISLDSVKARVHIVPDWSYAVISDTNENVWRKQQWIYNGHYMLF